MKTVQKQFGQKAFFCLATFFALAINAHAQGPLQWIQQYDRPSAIGSQQMVKTTDVAYTANGSVIVAGNVKENTGTSLLGETDAGIVKFSPGGAVLNTFFYDYNSTGGTDETVRIIANGVFVYALVKGQYNVSPSFDYDFYVIKFDTNLFVLGSVFFNGTGNVSDVPVDMGIDAAGNVYVTGNTQRTSSGQDIVLLKYNADLALQFTRYYTSAGVAEDAVTDMKVEPSGACNITGYTTTAARGQRLLAMKYWGNGVLLWKNYYDANTTNTNIDQGRALSYDPVTGDIYVTGIGYVSSNADWVVVKFSGSDGTRLWAKRYAGADNNEDAGVDISFFSSDALYVCGKYRSTVSGITATSIQLKKLAPIDGAAVWTKGYIGPAATGSTTPRGAFVSSMLVTPSENIYVFGSTNRETPGYIEANHLILNYTSSGTLTWSDLQSAASTSGFQSFGAVKGAYIPSSQVLYVAGTKNVTMSFVGTWSIAKYSPTALVDPVEENYSARTLKISDNLNVSFFPNPFNDIVTVATTSELPLQHIAITDMLGKVVYTNRDQQAPIQINTARFAKGVYQLMVQTAEGTVVRKMVKE